MRLIEPLGLIGEQRAIAVALEAGVAVPLAGGPLAFSLARLLPEPAPRAVNTIPGPWRDTLSVVTASPSSRWPRGPTVMGVLNVTPDSFSDGGEHAGSGAAIAAGLAMAEAGAAIIDVGGESTRPGAAPITPALERARVVPVIEGLVRQGIRVSIDSRNSETMAAALDAGAAIVNDVSALAHDPAAAPLLARSNALVVLMHMRGVPATMASYARYEDVAREVTEELATRLTYAEASGIARARIALDPGIGFAKTGAQNLELLARLPLLLNLGCPLVVGVSRKRFIGAINDISSARERLAGSLAAALHALAHGASVLRVHDVAATKQAIEVWQALTVGLTREAKPPRHAAKTAGILLPENR